MNYYEQMNPRAVDDVLELAGVNKERARALYHALDNAEQRGFLNGAKEMADAVQAASSEIIERVSLREFSNGFAEGVRTSRMSPAAADTILSSMGSSAYACGQEDTMPEPEFYQGDSGDETPELRCDCEVCRNS